MKLNPYVVAILLGGVFILVESAMALQGGAHQDCHVRSFWSMVYGFGVGVLSVASLHDPILTDRKALVAMICLAVFLGILTI